MMKEMQSILGMANYLRRFTPGLALLTTALGQFIQKGSAYASMPLHQVAFQAIIDDICKETIVRYYRPHLDLVLECDASKIAVGMSLLQDFMQDPLNVGMNECHHAEATGLCNQDSHPD